MPVTPCAFPGMRRPPRPAPRPRDPVRGGLDGIDGLGGRDAGSGQGPGPHGGPRDDLPAGGLA